MKQRTMKTFLTLTGLLAAVISGCASQQPMGQEAGGMARVDTPIQNVEGLPQWVTQKGAAFSGERRVLHGVGSSSGLVNPTMRRKAAEVQARRDLADTMEVYVAALNKQYMSETTAGDLSRHDVEQHITDVTKQITQQTLNGAQIVEYWEHPLRNEAYALARLDMDQFVEVMSSYKSASEKFQQLDAQLREQIKQNAEKAHDELNQELHNKK